MKLFLEDLMYHSKFEEAARECAELFRGDDPTMWDFWIIQFIKRNQLHTLAKYIPLENPTLESTMYEFVLEKFLNENKEESARAFLDTIKRWGRCEPRSGDPAASQEIYSKEWLMQQISERQRQASDSIAVRAAILEAEVYFPAS